MTGHVEALLRLVLQKASLHQLVEAGLEYAQISQLLVEALEQGLLKPEEGSVVLTDAGRAALVAADERGRPSRDGHFIEPAIEYRIDKIAVGAIYLPPRKRSFFDLVRQARP